ncbi:galactofuranosylgalactofuranosylrhamnosyl-N-acetylglucosaminyl-diphospho-decaprenol beta-1,5/1,6-galactofuranosyltransferase [Prauserella shujinwangii]|uniref:Galactofuranosylgalactofuranosylrhamnosyl-N-acetylglucosaminyl-diphospho-decaprenol beta-1,5/1,6-galactofuranosyltransferase n=1 Tax=Prauserella shujinwangii TaxID=1453103 RepID=A0A2T0LVX6_9PSEU|nr:glycosyltransferase [Prauserella shujinwangii]PRX47919.1 galactofuranosylgalactofuranosylrhamnosyl-N-acetylglucosaminyl-diphospho-decaprenol beta-1,5/1,6-galactofuranosyltransferase [Prauserella shujinwangii]
MAEQAVEAKARAANAAAGAVEDSKVQDSTQADIAGGRTETVGTQVLQRVILPRDSDPLDVRPLYIDEPKNVHTHVASRRSVVIPKSTRVSFASYFNAFPASYWKRWSVLDEVVLRMYVRGEGRVDLYRSRVNGDIIHLQGQPVHSPDEWATVELRVSLAPFGDGGWIWFDAFTDSGELEISEAAWMTDHTLPQKKMSVGITTFNRPADCVSALIALGEDPAVLDSIGTVFVADQGNKKISEHPRYAEAVAALGDRLQVIEQGNLGGSGGFTRAMLESLERTDSDQILLMDDDIVLEPDTVLRLSRFGAAAAQPVIVGGQMLNLQARARLHSMGEAVDMTAFRWGPAPGAKGGHDFAVKSLREEPWLHRRIDVAYNGWWMCLFPREAVEKVGMPLPMFIKWDDAEYGLRAGEMGFPTATLPGAGVWHMPWTDKDDTADWTVYFHLRNKLVAMALHSPQNITTTVLKQAAKDAARRLFSMQYSAIAIEQKAINDFLAGPDHFFNLLPSALSEVQAIRREYDDAKFKPSLQDYPRPMLDMGAAEPLLRPPVHPAKIAVRAAQALVHNVKPPNPDTHERPQLNVPADRALWFVLGNFDSATVSSPDGASVAFRKRDPEAFRKLAREVVANYRRLIKEFPRMKEEYRAALPRMSSVEAWRKLYESAS